MDELIFAGIALVLGLYGLWAVRRDGRRGRASARGFGFDKALQPRRYSALMAFNTLAVILLLAGSVIEAGLFIWRRVSG